jgi:hypothetical protein
MTHLHEEFWEIIYVRRSTHAMLKREALERNLTMRDLADRLLRSRPARSPMAPTLSQTI